MSEQTIPKSRVATFEEWCEVMYPRKSEGFRMRKRAEYEAQIEADQKRMARFVKGEPTPADEMGGLLLISLTKKDDESTQTEELV